MIISCSRRTDIPAFYSDWFINRLRAGYVQVRNPMNAGQVRKISLAPSDVDCIVFWTKNPTPMLDKLSFLADYIYYFQFTLTPYDGAIEPYLPPKTQLLDTFLRLSDEIGKKKIIWRYDPILFSTNIGIGYHVDHFGELAGILSGHTDKCVISFLDMYRHTHTRTHDLSVRPPDESEMRMLAKNIAHIGDGCNMKVETCAEKIDLSDLGIAHGKCIDDRLVSELTGSKLNLLKDKYQRKLCGCVTSVDIGQYNTCGHLCKYCYANVGANNIEKNRSLHNPFSPLLTGEIGDN